MQRFQILRRRSVLQRVAVWDLRSHAAADARRAAMLATSSRGFASYPDHEVVGLPALSPTMTSGTIAKWLKQEGEHTGVGDVVCQVQTDKAVVDFESQDEFFIAKILKPEGDAEIAVGEPIFVSVADEADIAAFKTFAIEAAPAQAQEAAAPTPAPAAPAPAAPAAAPAAPVNASGRVFASPLAKKIARETGAVLAAINGSGPNGRVLKADVEAALAQGTAKPAAVAAAAPAPAAPVAAPSVSAGFTDYPISAEAQAVAQQLTQQKHDVPHFHLSVELTMDKLLSARDRLNAGLDDEHKLSVNDFIVRAATLAMKKIPEANSAWKGSFIREFHDVHVNLMVSTAAGGVVSPVIPNVNRKGLVEIAHDTRAIVEKANASTLTAEDLASGTFTISNVGMYELRSFAGIVSPGQSCFLGLGTIAQKVVPNDDPEAKQIYKYAQVMTATLACDHRVVDGAVGAQWMQVFKELVEDPLKMVL